MRLVVVFLFIILVPMMGFSQVRSSLERERNAIIKKIEQTDKILQFAEKKSKNALQKLDLLNVEIRDRETLIDNSAKELAFIIKSEKNLSLSKDSIKTLLSRAQKEYNSLLKIQYREKLMDTKWSYIFGAKDINDAFLRYQYMEQYKTYIREKSVRLQLQSASYNTQLSSLKNEQENKKNILKIQQDNIQSLQKTIKAKNIVLKKINDNKSKLNTQLSEAKSRREQLNTKIEKAIIKELNNVASSTANSSKAITVNSDFSSQKRHLPWPISSPVLVSKYGIQNHKDLKSVKVANNGIDIRSTSTQVRALYTGKVIANIVVVSDNNMVIVQHGEYYSVYANLQNVVVQLNQSIGTQQLIGTISQAGTLHLEIWHNKKKVNPTNWLKNLSL